MGMKRRFEGKTVWITGGGSGIGKALALKFASEGARVAVSGRRVERLDEVKDLIEASGGSAFAVPLDVTQELSVKAAVSEIVAGGRQLDVVIANAGFVVSGKIERLSAEDWRRQFDTNVIGLAMTAKYALSHLRSTQGRLGLVGSVASFVSLPGYAPYHASKYAVRAIGHALSLEAKNSGVSCTLLHPGFVQSEIGQVDNEGIYHPDLPDTRPKPLMWSAARAADSMVHAVYRRKREHVFTGHGRFVALLGQHFPGLIHHPWMWSRIGRRSGKR